MKKILEIALIIIIIIILTFNVLSIFEISFFGFRMFKVASGSMEPSIPVNSLILIRKTDSYGKGDIITYKDYTNYTTHRIVEINENYIITKGDANNIEDKPIIKDLVVGKLVFSVNIFKFVSNVAVSPIFWIVIFFLGIFCIVTMPKGTYLKKTRPKRRNVENKYIK